MNIGEWLQYGANFLGGVQGKNANNEILTGIAKLLGNNQTNNVSNIAANVGSDVLSQVKFSNALQNAASTDGIYKYKGMPGTSPAAQQVQTNNLSDMLSNGGAIIGGLWNVYSGIHGMRQNNKRFKSDMASAALQRSIAQEQMDIMRKEYNRLNRQRAAVSKAYGG